MPHLYLVVCSIVRVCKGDIAIVEHSIREVVVAVCRGTCDYVGSDLRRVNDYAIDKAVRNQRGLNA